VARLAQKAYGAWAGGVVAGIAGEPQAKTDQKADIIARTQQTSARRRQREKLVKKERKERTLQEDAAEEEEPHYMYLLLQLAEGRIHSWHHRCGQLSLPSLWQAPGHAAPSESTRKTYLKTVARSAYRKPSLRRTLKSKTRGFRQNDFAHSLAPRGRSRQAAGQKLRRRQIAGWRTPRGQKNFLRYHPASKPQQSL